MEWLDDLWHELAEYRNAARETRNIVREAWPRSPEVRYHEGRLDAYDDAMRMLADMHDEWEPPEALAAG